MSLKRVFEKVKYIDNLISRKATGGQKELANRVGLSVSTINVYLNEMKEAGFPIKYCNKRRTYYYEKEGKMVSSLFQEYLDKSQMKNIDGGLMYFGTPIISEWGHGYL
jgi:DNA-binding IclR family transcriptional regulator